MQVHVIHAAARGAAGHPRPQVLPVWHADDDRRPGHPGHFIHRCPKYSLRQVLQHLAADDGVERPVGKGQTPAGSENTRALYPLQRLLRWIEADDKMLGPQPACQEAVAAAEVEDRIGLGIDHGRDHPRPEPLVGVTLVALHIPDCRLGVVGLQPAAGRGCTFGCVIRRLSHGAMFQLQPSAAREVGRPGSPRGVSYLPFEAEPPRQSAGTAP